MRKSSGQKVMTGHFSGSNEGRERFVERWTGELRKKPLEEDRRLEARKTTKMEQEDSSFGRRTEWAFIFLATSTTTIPGVSTLNCDVELGVVR